MAKQAVHWRARADDYQLLAKAVVDPDLRQVLHHLFMVCNRHGEPCGST
jgi:hypothetical protein